MFVEDDGLVASGKYSISFMHLTKHGSFILILCACKRISFQRTLKPENDPELNLKSAQVHGITNERRTAGEADCVATKTKVLLSPYRIYKILEYWKLCRGDERIFYATALYYFAFGALTSLFCTSQ